MELGRILLGVVVTAASFLLVQSLSCNKCSFRIVGVCFDQEVQTCSTNTSVCFTGEATFPSLPAFGGFATQGCREALGCNATTNSSLLDLSVQVALACCSTDRCNPAQLSAAPSTSTTTTTLALTLAVGAAGLALSSG